MKFFVAWFGKVIAYTIFHLPVRAQLFLGDCVGLLWWDVLRLRRRIVLENLKIAFPEKSDAERKSMARQSLRLMGRGFVEYFKLPFINKSNWKTWMSMEGVEHYEKALALGKGVCFLSLHLDNGDFSLSGMGMLGHPIYLISKEFKWKGLNDLWFGLRRRHGLKFIAPRGSSVQILKALKRGESVIFVQDQFMGPPIGCEVEFFGKKTGAALGLSIIAQRTGSPVLPLYTVRTGVDQHKIVIEAPIVWEEKEGKTQTQTHMTQVYTNKIEELIRKYPEQWMWVHKRWKPFNKNSRRVRQ